MTTRSKIEILETQLAELQQIHTSTLEQFTEVHTRATRLEKQVQELRESQITEELSNRLHGALIVLEYLLLPITDSCGRVPSTPPLTVTDDLSTAVYKQIQQVRCVIEAVTAGC